MLEIGEISTRGTRFANQYLIDGLELELYWPPNSQSGPDLILSLHPPYPQHPPIP